MVWACDQLRIRFTEPKLDAAWQALMLGTPAAQVLSEAEWQEAAYKQVLAEEYPKKERLMHRMIRAYPHVMREDSETFAERSWLSKLYYKWQVP